MKTAVTVGNSCPFSAICNKLRLIILYVSDGSKCIIKQLRRITFNEVWMTPDIMLKPNLIFCLSSGKEREASSS